MMKTIDDTAEYDVKIDVWNGKLKREFKYTLVTVRGYELLAVLDKQATFIDKRNWIRAEQEIIRVADIRGNIYSKKREE